jgi:hypothetical protein
MANANTQVQELYVAYFNRPADVAGLKYWSDILADDPNAYKGIAQDFSSSWEYMMTYNGLTNRQIVDTVYQHLFGRAAEAAGVDYWAGLLDQKALTVANVVTEVAHGAQGSDKVVIDGRVAVAAVFTDHLDTTLEQLAYSGVVANQTASAYLAAITDAQSAARALAPENIDAAISQFAGPIVNPIFGVDAEVVGVPPLHA